MMSAPPEARAVVMAVPRPPVPPVIMAVLPVREKSLDISTGAAILNYILIWVGRKLDVPKDEAVDRLKLKPVALYNKTVEAGLLFDQ